MPSPRNTPGAVGLVATRSPMFDAQMPDGFAQDLADATDEIVRVLEREFQVVYPGLICDETQALAANKDLAQGDLDAVIFAPSMAAPPRLAELALEGIDAPVLIWNMGGMTELPHRLDQASAHLETRLIGAMMYANVMTRQNRQFSVVSAPFTQSDLALRRLRALVAATRLRGMTALRLGQPISGYSDVAVTRHDLESLGIDEVALDSAVLRSSFLDVSDDRLEEVLAAVAQRGWSGTVDRESARLAAAVAGLAEREGADLGTVNCHGPFFRDSADIGIVACLAVTMLSDAGCPVSCTGDLPTAIALKLGQLLGGAALYGELYTFERSTGRFLFANGGEGDTRLAVGAVRVCPTSHYPGLRGNGATVAFDLKAGPATLLTLWPSPDGWRAAWALVEVEESRAGDLHAPAVLLRFSNHQSPEEAATAWVRSGAAHHSALVPGHLDVELPEALGALGVSWTSV